MTAHNSFRLQHFALRFLLSTVLIFGTYNPVGLSIYHWITTDPYANFVPKLLITIFLLVTYAFVVRVVYSMIQLPGLILGIVVVSLTIFEIYHYVRVGENGTQLLQIVALFTLSFYVSFSLSFPLFVGRLSGQWQKRYLTGKKAG